MVLPLWIFFSALNFLCALSKSAGTHHEEFAAPRISKGPAPELTRLLQWLNPNGVSTAFGFEGRAAVARRDMAEGELVMRVPRGKLLEFRGPQKGLWLAKQLQDFYHSLFRATTPVSTSSATTSASDDVENGASSGIVDSAGASGGGSGESSATSLRQRVGEVLFPTAAKEPVHGGDSRLLTSSSTSDERDLNSEAEAEAAKELGEEEDKLGADVEDEHGTDGSVGGSAAAGEPAPFVTVGITDQSFLAFALLERRLQTQVRRALRSAGAGSDVDASDFGPYMDVLPWVSSSSTRRHQRQSRRSAPSLGGADSEVGEDAAVETPLQTPSTASGSSSTYLLTIPWVALHYRDPRSEVSLSEVERLITLRAIAAVVPVPSVEDPTLVREDIERLLVEAIGKGVVAEGNSVVQDVAAYSTLPTPSLSSTPSNDFAHQLEEFDAAMQAFGCLDDDDGGGRPVASPSKKPTHSDASPRLSFCARVSEHLAQVHDDHRVIRRLFFEYLKRDTGLLVKLSQRYALGFRRGGGVPRSADPQTPTMSAIDLSVSLRALRAVLSALFGPAGFLSRDAFVDARALWDSRQFCAIADGSLGAPGPWGGSSSSILIPFGDMLNHDLADYNVLYSYNQTAAAMEFRLKRDVPAGHPLTNSYGEKSGARWLLHYGFVDSHRHNPHSQSGLTVKSAPAATPPTAAPLRRVRVRLGHAGLGSLLLQLRAGTAAQIVGKARYFRRLLSLSPVVLPAASWTTLGGVGSGAFEWHGAEEPAFPALDFNLHVGGGGWVDDRANEGGRNSEASVDGLTSGTAEKGNKGSDGNFTSTLWTHPHQDWPEKVTRDFEEGMLPCLRLLVYVPQDLEPGKCGASKTPSDSVQCLGDAIHDGSYGGSSLNGADMTAWVAALKPLSFADPGEGSTEVDDGPDVDGGDILRDFFRSTAAKRAKCNRYSLSGPKCDRELSAGNELRALVLARATVQRQLDELGSLGTTGATSTGADADGHATLGRASTTSRSPSSVMRNFAHIAADERATLAWYLERGPLAEAEILRRVVNVEGTLHRLASAASSVD